MTEYTVEVDDVHKFMVQEMTEEDTEVGDFLDQMVETTIYNYYNQWKAQQDEAQPEDEAEELIEEAEPTAD